MEKGYQVCGTKVIPLTALSHYRRLVDRESFLSFYFVLAIFCTGVGTLLGTDDLLVAFACGCAFAWEFDLSLARADMLVGGSQRKQRNLTSQTSLICFSTCLSSSTMEPSFLGI
jgi:Sodium/hydrogen exchanger family